MKRRFNAIDVSSTEKQYIPFGFVNEINGGKIGLIFWRIKTSFNIFGEKSPISLGQISPATVFGD